MIYWLQQIFALMAYVWTPALATSITVTDSCQNYNVNNSQGVLSVTCQGDPTPPPPPNPPTGISCKGYTNTIVLTFPYSKKGTQQQITAGQLSTDIIVATFTTPSVIGSPTFGTSDNQPNPTGMRGKLSTTACDVTGTQFDYYSLSYNPANGWKPNTTYYVNVLATDPIWFNFIPR